MPASGSQATTPAVSPTEDPEEKHKKHSAPTRGCTSTAFAAQENAGVAMHTAPAGSCRSVRSIAPSQGGYNSLAVELDGPRRAWRDDTPAGLGVRSCPGKGPSPLAGRIISAPNAGALASQGMCVVCPMPDSWRATFSLVVRRFINATMRGLRSARSAALRAR